MLEYDGQWKLLQQPYYIVSGLVSCFLPIIGTRQGNLIHYVLFLRQRWIYNSDISINLLFHHSIYLSYSSCRAGSVCSECCLNFTHYHDSSTLYWFNHLRSLPSFLITSHHHSFISGFLDHQKHHHHHHRHQGSPPPPHFFHKAITKFWEEEYYHLITRRWISMDSS